MKNLPKRALKLLLLLADGRFAYVAYAAKNRFQRLDFGYVGLEQLGLPADRAHHHTNSGGPELARIVETLDIPPGTRALDLGSGKGGAVLTLSRLGYERVVGVEIASELVEIARTNARRARRTNVEFIVSDATEFTAFDEFAHIYMYNPFPGSVMTEVVANLAASVERSPRILKIVYCNPQFHDVIMNTGLFTLEREFAARAINLIETHGSPYFVYTHRPSRDGGSIG